MKRLSLAVLLAAAVMAAVTAAKAEPIWVKDGAGISGTFRDVCMLNDSIGWAVGDNGVVYKRTGILYPTTGQQVWFSQMVMAGQNNWDFTGVSFVDENNGWIVGYRNIGPGKYKGVILRTGNGGGSWTVKYSTETDLFGNTPDSLTPFLKVRMGVYASIYYGYISCGNGYILKWRPDLNRWLPIRPFAPEMDPSDTISTWYKDVWMDPDDPNKVWAMGDHSGVMVKSVDGGVNWDASYPDIFTQSYVFPPHTYTLHGTRVA